MRALAIRALEAFADLAGAVADRAEDVARRLRRDQLPTNHPLGSGWVDMGWIFDEEPEVPAAFRKTAPSPELKRTIELMRQHAGRPRHYTHTWPTGVDVEPFSSRPSIIETGMPVHDAQRAWPTFERGWE